MKNPFKKQKAHRFRGYSPTKEQLQQEFDRVLQIRVALRIKKALGEEKDIQKFFEYKMEHGDHIYHGERARLMIEIKDSGRSIEFTRKPGQDLLFKAIKGGKE